jgi:hypothetical protein
MQCSTLQPFLSPARVTNYPFFSHRYGELLPFFIMSSSTDAESTNNDMIKKKKLVIATRLHLGKTSSPPSDSSLKATLANFEGLAKTSNGIPVIAVDATPKLPDYDFVQAVRENLPDKSCIQIVPVTPWGKFVPALNALVLFAASDSIQADWILFVSAEVSATPKSIQTLCDAVIDDTDDDVIVAGAAMNGHVYITPTTSGENTTPKVIELNGRTCPWNTLAVWNVRKLSLTGFQLCSDLGDSAGVEECVAIAVLQKLFPKSQAKLIKLDDISWEESFDDEERQKWHETKMTSKLERAARQMQRLQLSGTVTHC